MNRESRGLQNEVTFFIYSMLYFVLMHISRHFKVNLFFNILKAKRCQGGGSVSSKAIIQFVNKCYTRRNRGGARTPQICFLLRILLKADRNDLPYSNIHYPLMLYLSMRWHYGQHLQLASQLGLEKFMAFDETKKYLQIMAISVQTLQNLSLGCFFSA